MDKARINSAELAARSRARSRSISAFAGEPVVKPGETVRPGFDLHPPVDAEQRHADVPAKPAARSARERNAFGCKTFALQIAD
jgi:hypothetical protein